MNKSEQEYRDVSPSIKDIIWEIFSHYKFILLITVVVTLLISGGKYLDYKNQVKQEQNRVPVTLEEIKNGLSDVEIADVDVVRSWENQLASLHDYRIHSLLYEINPYAVDMISMQWSIKISNDGLDIDEQSMYIGTIIDTYDAYIENGGLAANISKNFRKEIEIKYIQELISVNRTDNSFVINIMIPQSMVEENLAEKIQTQLKVYEVEVAEKLYDHEIALMNYSEQIVVDTKLSSKIVEMENQVSNLNGQIDRAIATFTPQQLMFYNGECVGGEVSNITFDIKYIIIGVILGFVGSCVILLLRYLLSDSVKSTEGITGAFGWNGISNIYVDNTNGFYAKIRKRLQYNSLISTEEQIEHAALKVGYMCKQKGINQVVLTSSLQKMANNEKTIILLKTFLEQKDIRVVESWSCLDDVSKLGTIINVGSVILLEEIMKSNYSDLENVKKEFELQNINILGVIAIHNI